LTGIFQVFSKAVSRATTGARYEEDRGGEESPIYASFHIV